MTDGSLADDGSTSDESPSDAVSLWVRVRVRVRGASSMPWLVGGIALVVVLLLSLHGPQRFLDTGSYAAAIDHMVQGRGATSTLVPAFSEFSVDDFVAHRFSVPFVDFPIGYPLVASLFASVVGVRRAMMVVTLLSSAAVAVLLAANGARGVDRRSRWYWVAAIVGAVGIVVHPAMLVLTRAGLSEPLFIALVLGATVCTMRSTDASHNDRTPAAVLLVGAASLVRFVGVATLVVPAAVMIRRRGIRRSWHWMLGAIALPLANSVWATSEGGGHQFALREITAFDVRLTLHSITGWFVNHYASYASVFRNGWPSWWLLPIGVAWIVAVLVAIGAVLLGRAWLPAQLQVPFAMAGMLVVGLYGGMLCIDSLVTADVRLMIPSGVLTLAALFWWATERLDRRTVLCLVVVWLALAVAPWRLHPQAAQRTHPELAAVYGDANFVVSDNADQVWWETGTPAMYLPQVTRPLTGESVDRDAALAALPCLLYEQVGAVVLMPGPFVDVSLRASLDALAAEHRFVVSRVATFDGELVRYTPIPSACVSDSSP